MPSPNDFELRPSESRAKLPETPRLLEVPYPDPREEEGAAEPGADISRRKKRNTARLVWDSKPKKAPNPKNLGFQIAEVVVPNPATQSGPRLPFDPVAQEVDTTACNRLIWGDNLLVMQALLAQGYEGKINLIYIDPPFDSKADYSHTVQLTPDASGQGGGELNAEMSAMERLAYRDTWEDGTDSYLDMLFPRLQLMHRLLANDGTLILHCDWHVTGFLRILLDEVFGKDKFVSEIIWHFSNKYGANSDAFDSFHNTLFLFRKGVSFTFNPIKVPVKEVRKQPFRKWNKELGLNEWQRDGQGNYIYVESSEKELGDVWEVPVINPVANERIGYNTQKPETLLSHVVSALTNPGDLVADFFCGSGTTAAVAEKLGRRWITSDLGKASIQVARNRFVKMGEAGSGGIAFQRPDGATRCSPFVVENLGNYQRQLIYLNDHKLRQVGPLILTLFGAQSHPSERNLGTQAFNDPESGRFQRRLVLVGDPDRPLSAKRVAEAARMLKTLDGGGYSKLVALGWDFELNFDSALEKLLGAEWRKVVEARQIPTEVIEYLKKIPERAGPDDPTVEKLRAQVAFFEKPYLGIPELAVLGWTRELEPRLRARLRLTRYTLRGLPMGILGKKPSEQEARELIQKAGGSTGLNLIDFWSVDEDLGSEDGKRPFTSSWQELRGLGKRVRPVATETELIYVPRPGRKVGMRLVDIFGNDAMWSGLLPDAEDARRAGL